MALSLDSLRAALAAPLAAAAEGVNPVGGVLATQICGWLEANRATSEIAEVYYWAYNVEFVLRNGDYWAIECLSPTDFRMYPGFVRGDTVTWANIWVRDSNMSLDELVKDINDVAFRPMKKESQNA